MLIPVLNLNSGHLLLGKVKLSYKRFRICSHLLMITVFSQPLGEKSSAAEPSNGAGTENEETPSNAATYDKYIFKKTSSKLTNL